LVFLKFVKKKNGRLFGGIMRMHDGGVNIEFRGELDRESGKTIKVPNTKGEPASLHYLRTKEGKEVDFAICKDNR
jgi:hypothetical protein